MRSAILRRSPITLISLIEVSATYPAVCGEPPASSLKYASMSSCVIRPAGPVPRTRLRSMPASRARSLTEGVASGFSPSARTGPAPVKVRFMASRLGAAGFSGTGVCKRTGAASSAFALGGSTDADGSVFTDSGFTDSCLLSAAPSISSRTSSEPTAIFSPISPLVSTTLPARDDGISTVALSVITAASRSSSRTISPTFTCHSTSSASATPSPTSGSLIVK